MKLLTVKQAANKLGITYSTARARCAAYDIGKKYGTVRLLDQDAMKKLAAIKPKRGRPAKKK